MAKKKQPTPEQVKQATVIEIIKHKDKPHHHAEHLKRFTTETARAAGLKGAETKRKRKEAREAARGMTRKEMTEEYFLAHVPEYWKVLHEAAVKRGDTQAAAKCLEYGLGKPTQFIEATQENITIVRPPREQAS